MWLHVESQCQRKDLIRFLEEQRRDKTVAMLGQNHESHDPVRVTHLRTGPYSDRERADVADNFPVFQKEKHRGSSGVGGLSHTGDREPALTFPSGRRPDFLHELGKGRFEPWL
jgi:hypothetical protein